MTTKLDAVKSLADRYRGETLNQDNDTEKRKAALSLAQSYQKQASAKREQEKEQYLPKTENADRTEDADRTESQKVSHFELSDFASGPMTETDSKSRHRLYMTLADAAKTPADYNKVSQMKPIGEQTDEEIASKIDFFSKELERLGGTNADVSLSLNNLLIFEKTDEERKQALEETQDALYAYEAEKQKRTDEKLLALAETMTDDEIDERVQYLKTMTPGIFHDIMAGIGIVADTGERDAMKRELSLLQDYQYDRKRQAEMESYTSGVSSDADAEQYIEAGMAIEAPSWSAPWDERRLYAALTGNIVEAYGLTSAGMTAGAPEDKALAYLTDEERNVVAYYVGRGETEKALSYLDAITDDLFDRQAVDSYETAKTTAAEHPVLGSAARVMAGVGKMGGAIGTVYQNVKNEVTGEYEPLRESSPWFAGNRTAAATEEGVLSNIDNDFLKFLAQTGFSIADNVTNRLLFGNTFALAAMGMQAAGDGAYNAVQNGASPEDALVLGIAAGGIEYLTEKIPFDHLTDMLHSVGKTGVKGALTEIAKQMGSEALEEATSEYANLIVDALVRGDESEYNRYIAELVANGMNFSDAEKKAIMEYYVKNPALSAAGGALSGGVMGGGASVISGITGNSLGNVNIGNRDSVTSALQSLGETAESADALYDSVYLVVNGKGSESDINAVASSDAASTFVALQQKVRSRKSEKTQRRAEKMANRIQDDASRAKETGTSRQASSDVREQADSAYGRYGTKLWERYGDAMQSPDYREAFSRFYEAGKAGITFEKADAIDPYSAVPKGERYRMWAAGQNDVPVSQEGFDADSVSGWKREEIAVVDKLAKALGVRVTTVNNIYVKGSNNTALTSRARFDGDTIEISRTATSSQAMMQVMGHEFTHRLKQLSPDAYARLESFALAHSQTSEEVRARYASLNLSESDMAEEITARYAEALFSDEETVKRIANEDRGLAERIWDFIKDLIGRIRGKVPTELEQAERLWRDALHSASDKAARLNRNAGKNIDTKTKNTARKDGGKFSIAYTTENKPVVVIKEDILAGKDPSEWVKTVKNTIRDKFSGGIPVSGRLVKVTKETRNEFTYSKYTQNIKRSDNLVYVDKMKSANHLDEIVLASTNYINEDLKHTREDSFKEFARGDILMRVDDRDYSARVIIGYTSKGEMVLYDIVDFRKDDFKLKNKGISRTVSSNTNNSRQDIPFDNTISQSEDNVNSHDMQISEKYSLAYDVNNTPYVIVDEDILNGVPKEQWASAVKSVLLDKFGSGIPVGSNVIYVNGKTRAEMTYSEYTKWLRRKNPEIYEDKLKALNYTDEIVKASRNYVEEGPKHPRKDKFTSFAKGDVLLRVGNHDYRADVIVGYTSENNMILYDVIGFNPTTIQEKQKSKRNSSSYVVENDRLQKVALASDTISQSEDNVNTHDMQIPEKYSLDAMDKTEELLEQYGALPEGERTGSAAGREVKVPRRTSKDNKTRRTVRTVMEAAVTSDEIAGNLKEKIENGEFSYLPTSNKKLLENAETMVKEKGFDAVLSEWKTYIDSTREANDRMLGVGEYLLIHALKTKDANLAGTLAVELSVEATAAGRSVSAVRMIKQLGPAAKIYEVMHTVDKLSETTIERKGSRKAVDELSEKRNTLMAEYKEKRNSVDDARHEVETLEFLRDNLKASEKTAGKIKELETEIQKLQGLLEKSKNPAKKRELGERLETANGELAKAKELAGRQRESREDAADDLAKIQERIRKAERKTEQDMRRIEKLIEKIRSGDAQTEAPGANQAQELTAEVSEALAEAQERLRRVTAEAGNMHAKYNRIMEIDKELHKLGKYTVDPVLLEAFAAAKTVKDAENAGNEILLHVAKQVPATFADKWNAFRYLSMLGNIRTHVRNFFGNAVFVPAVRMKNLIASALEAGTQKNGGVRTKDLLHSVLGWHDEYRAFAKADFKEMQDIIKSGGKYNPASKIDENRTIYTSKMFRWLEKLRKGNSDLLDTEDGIFLRLHYTDSLAGYLAANKINLKTIDDVTLDRARAYAMEEAWKATYRDFSKTAAVLQRLSGTNTFTKIFVEGLIPFKKTPVNILKRGVEYSPVGLLRTLTKGLSDVKKGNITAAQFIDGISSGLTGTALIALGYLFASLGFIEPGIGDDEEDKLAELQGKQGYALVLGDMSYTIDWMAPAAIPIFVGTTIHDLFHETGEDSPEVMDALYDVVEPVFEMSMLQGIENALSAVKYGGDGYAVGNILFEGVTGYFGQAVPTALGQVARTIDGTRRTTYTESGAPLASGSRFIQSIMNKIPGLSLLNEPYVDEWGREETTESIAWRLFNNFVSPGYSSAYETSPMEEELKRLYESTGEDVFPRTAPKYFSADGIRVSMNAKEHTTYQKAMGKTAYHTLTEMTELASYRKAEDALRVKAIDKAYDYAAEMAKKAVLGKDYTAPALVIHAEEATSAGIRVSEYLMFSAAVSEMKNIYGRDGKTVILSKQDQVEEYLRRLSLRTSQKKVLWNTLYDSKSPWG